MFKRSLILPEPGSETFFLWGPRQAGKSTLLRSRYPAAWWIDLLKAEEFRRYLDHPEFMRQELVAAPPVGGRQIVIDEIQKAPALLDEVHWLIERWRRRRAPASPAIISGDCPPPILSGGSGMAISACSRPYSGSARRSALTTAAALPAARSRNVSIRFSPSPPPARSDRLRMAMNGTSFA